MGHSHSVRDTGAHFIIDPYTRVIKNDSANKTTIVQYDHNSERLTFEMPLYIDGHAMTLCNLIELHYINISTDGKAQNTGTYEVTDIAASGDMAIMTWLISQNATQLVGSLNFIIVFKCVEDGETVYRWSTEICKTLAVSSGMDNGEEVLTDYPDILAQWKAQIFGASGDAVLAVETAEANALAAIEAAANAKQQAVLDSIPDEYEELSALADSNYRNKAGAIVVNAEGESIVLNDASEYPLQSMSVFGKSTQDGTPTPDAPVDIVSIENPVVEMYSKNILYPTMSGSPVERNGVTFTPVYDEGGHLLYITATGTATELAYCSIVSTMNLPNGEYILSGCPTGGGAAVYDIRFNGTSARDYGEGSLFTITEETAQNSITCVVASGVTVTDLRFRPMIRVASIVDDTYEPCAEQTLETSYTLPGIPVSSGGNYTDADGQQWICDEVDLARGVYVQRCASVKITSAEGLGTHSTGVTYVIKIVSDVMGTTLPISDRYAGAKWSDENSTCYTLDDKLIINDTRFVDLDTANSILANEQPQIIYQLTAPAETALTDAEITAFKALCTNKPNTTIMNDAGAYMAVEYVADTKTYIDNKIKEMTEEVE